MSGPEDVDFAMIMGAGFAPFRGGPLRYADAVGVANLVGEMNALTAAGEARFAPCELLKNLATNDGKLYPQKGAVL